MRSKTSNEAKLARRKPKKMEHLCPEAIHRPRLKERKENVSDNIIYYISLHCLQRTETAIEKIVN